MHLSDELKKCSEEDFDNAILVALATHRNPQVKNLASAYSDTEIEKIAKRTPTALLLIVSMTLEQAFKGTNDDPAAEVLARQLKQVITNKHQLDVLLASSLYSEGSKVCALKMQ